MALSISFRSPMTRRPDALFATNIASLILRPDLRFLALTSFQSFSGPSLSLGSSSRISRFRQSLSLSPPRRRPPGNIHNRSRLLLTSRTRPRLAATSLDDFAISGCALSVLDRHDIESAEQFIAAQITHITRPALPWPAFSRPVARNSARAALWRPACRSAAWPDRDRRPSELARRCPTSPARSFRCNISTPTRCNQRRRSCSLQWTQFLRGRRSAPEPRAGARRTLWTRLTFFRTPGGAARRGGKGCPRQSWDVRLRAITNGAA